MTAICASHYRNPLNDVLVGRKHHHQNRFRPRQSTRSAFYKPGLLAKGAEAGTDDRGASVDDREGQSHGNSNGNSNSNSHDNSNHNNNHRSHLGREGDWNFRPSALQHDDYGTGAMGVDELVDLYVRDNERAAMEGVVVPPRPRSKSLRWFLERERRACSNNSNRNSNNSNHNNNDNNKDEDSQHRHTKAASVRDALFSASSSATAASSPPKQPQHQNQQQYQQQNQHQRPRSFAQLRCLQWNIQAFTSPRDERNLQTITAGTIRSICETDSDVLVLNEIHWRDTEEQLQQQQHQQQEEERKAEFDFIHSSQSLLEEVLRLRGYRFVRVAVHGDTPTMVATRKKVLRYEEVVLSGNRSALCILVECHGIDHSECIGNGHFHSSGSGPSPSRCWVVGTHLDAFDGIQRAEEIQTLLSARLGERDCERDCERKRHLPVLVMGDFNQQRSGDYTGPEWNRIAGSAGLRKVPLDDGVAGLLEGKGFRCVLDAVRAGSGEGEAVRCNWDPHQPPPSTHWSGTTIDYTYYRCPAGHGGDSDGNSDAEGSEPEGRTTVHPHGVYVGPAGFSDHRMTVTDWTLATTKPTGRGKMQQHPHQPQQRPPRYMDKDFFFRHLPAGRHDSWRCAAAAPHRTPEGEPPRCGRPPPAFPACEKGSSSCSIGSTASSSSSSSSSCPSIGSESLHELFRPLCSE